MEMIIKLIPVISALIAGILGYLFAQRGKKNERFSKHVENSLEEVCGPLFYELRKIKEVNDSYKRERMLKGLFEKYTGENSKIHKIGNIYILECFYDLEKTFSCFIKERKDEDWAKFCVQFNKFCDMLENEYWQILSVIYRDYRWFTYNSAKSSYLKLMNDFLRFMYEVAKVLIIIWLFGLYFIVYQGVIGEELFPHEVNVIIMYSSLPVIMLFLFMWMAIIGYEGATNKRSGKIRRKLREKFPKMMRSWEGEIFEDVKIDDKNISIPDMYKKQGPFNM